MDLRKIKKLIELLEESALTEIEISEGEDSIRLTRGIPAPPAPAPSLQVVTGAPVAAMPAVAAPAAGGAEGESREEVAGHVVKSPMVGTYFSAPSPDEEDFVSIGSVVQEGDTLCIIEAMKIFNQVEADRPGTIRAIYKKSGDAVEFGEPLFVIE